VVEKLGLEDKCYVLNLFKFSGGDIKRAIDMHSGNLIERFEEASKTVLHSPPHQVISVIEELLSGSSHRDARNLAIMFLDFVEQRVIEEMENQVKLGRNVQVYFNLWNDVLEAKHNIENFANISLALNSVFLRNLRNL
jgi:hypothetical protein